MFIGPARFVKDAALGSRRPCRAISNAT